MMKKSVYLSLLLVLPFLLLSCGSERKAWMDNLSAAEKMEFKSGDVPEERIDNLKKGISFYSKEVERTVDASEQLGIYYRMLALEYMSLEMYNEALKSIEKAAEYFPTSPLIFYYGGVSAAQMSTAVFDDERTGKYLDYAEQYYLRALALDPRYKEALYGLSVLYVFELNRPFDAAPLLERLVDLSPTNYSAMFLLARVKLLSGETDAAEELYSIIEEKAPDDQSRERAKENRLKLIGGYSGG